MKKNIKVGFIGNGNMGSALAVAVSKAGYATLLYDPDTEKSRTLAEKTGGLAVDRRTLTAESDYIFLGVKPQVLSALADELLPLLDRRKDAPVLVSMAAGISIWKLGRLFGEDKKFIRIMPNTPVSVGCGMTLWCRNDSVTESEAAIFEDMMRESGKLDAIQEKFIDAASALSGCGPAFVYIFAEALADGGVLCGLPRDKALAYATQTLLGSAELLRESGEHPGALKDKVCSPGGSTIEGVRALEAHGFRAAAIDAVKSAYKRTVELGD